MSMSGSPSPYHVPMLSRFPIHVCMPKKHGDLVLIVDIIYSHHLGQLSDAIFSLSFSLAFFFLTMLPLILNSLCRFSSWRLLGGLTLRHTNINTQDNSLSRIVFVKRKVLNDHWKCFWSALIPLCSVHPTEKNNGSICVNSFLKLYSDCGMIDALEAF